MHREGFNPDDVQPQDVLCDFCGLAAWAQGIPCVEGHRGSLICGDCLRHALQSAECGTAGGSTCVMCLQASEGTVWRHESQEAEICRSCIKRAAGVLRKSKDWEWEA